METPVSMHFNALFDDLHHCNPSSNSHNGMFFIILSTNRGSFLHFTTVEFDNCIKTFKKYSNLKIDLKSP